jgi:hypothetical protein
MDPVGPGKGPTGRLFPKPENRNLFMGGGSVQIPRNLYDIADPFYNEVVDMVNAVVLNNRNLIPKKSLDALEKMTSREQVWEWAITNLTKKGSLGRDVRGAFRNPLTGRPAYGEPPMVIIRRYLDNIAKVPAKGLAGPRGSKYPHEDSVYGLVSKQLSKISPDGKINPELIKRFGPPINGTKATRKYVGSDSIEKTAREWADGKLTNEWLRKNKSVIMKAEKHWSRYHLAPGAIALATSAAFGVNAPFVAPEYPEWGGYKSNDRTANQDMSDKDYYRKGGRTPSWVQRMAIDGEECVLEFRVDPRFPMDNPQESVKMDKSFDRLDLKSRPFRLSGKRKDDIDPKDFKNYRQFSNGALIEYFDPQDPNHLPSCRRR